jgi:hypothetical protein
LISRILVLALILVLLLQCPWEECRQNIIIHLHILPLHTCLILHLVVPIETLYPG